jgi:hypothetical protein
MFVAYIHWHICDPHYVIGDTVTAIWIACVFDFDKHTQTYSLCRGDSYTLTESWNTIKQCELLPRATKPHSSYNTWDISPINPNQSENKSIPDTVSHNNYPNIMCHLPWGNWTLRVSQTPSLIANSPNALATNSHKFVKGDYYEVTRLGPYSYIKQSKGLWSNIRVPMGSHVYTHRVQKTLQ